MIPQEFKDQVQKYIDAIENDNWAKDVVLFAAKRLFNEGYDAVVAIDEDNIWKDSIITVKIKTEESEDWEFKETWLDIFAVDRKTDPMIFDERMESQDFAAEKILEILDCKVNLIFGAFEGFSAGEIYDKYPEKFERIVQRRNSYELNVR
jgi:hypothetical protein